MMRIPRRGSAGFTLVELLMVVAIIAILVAIAVPNLLTAINRARQKRTISAIRNIASAWEARAIDTSGYNASAATFPWPAVPVSFGDLQGLLTPDYIKSLPQEDGWGTDLEFACDLASAAQIYGIRSAAYDKEFDSDTYTVGLTSALACDIVYSNGVFIAYPQEGMGNN